MPVPLDLPVEGHRPAIVYAPAGATSRRPVLIATHGTYDIVEWFCPFFRESAGKDAFVICPRGVPRPDGARLPTGEVFHTYAGGLAIEKEVEASLAALRARFPDHVDDAAPIYLGWSLGAHRGKRVLCICGQPGCVTASNEASTLLEKAGIATKVVYAKGGGHSVQGPVADHLRVSFPWVTEDDPRWTVGR